LTAITVNVKYDMTVCAQDDRPKVFAGPDMPLMIARSMRVPKRPRPLLMGWCLVLLGFVPLVTAGHAVSLAPEVEAAAPDRRNLDEGLQQLKKDAVDLRVELDQLREDMLFPASNQVAVFVSIDVGEFLALDSVELKIDNKEVTHYLYTAREAAALLKGGTQRLYVGNLKSGDHELIAVFKGRGPHHRDYRRAATVHVLKGVVPKYIELKITDRKIRAQPEFEIKDWE